MKNPVSDVCTGGQKWLEEGTEGLIRQLILLLWPCLAPINWGANVPGISQLFPLRVLEDLSRQLRNVLRELRPQAMA